MKKAILAVDAGGTKTKVCVIDLNKEICYEKIGGPGSPAVAGIKAVEYILDLVLEVYNEIKQEYEILYIQMGISGLGTVRDKHIYEEKLYNELNIPVSMENDAILALFSIVEDKHNEGILVLSGTGSACYGVSGLSTQLIGGWGHLLSERGSSYTAVRSLVLDIINDYELGKPISPLGLSFMSLLKIEDVNSFKVFMYNNSKDEIASYAKFISEMALKGDLTAINILKESGVHLAECVKLIFKRLNLSSKAVIGFRGSFVDNAPFVKEEFFKSLIADGFDPKVVTGSSDPIYGAYFMAKRKLEIC